MAELITWDIAEKEVNDWLTWKRVPDAYIKGSQKYIKGIIIAVQEGTFTIDSTTKEITHKLKWPIGTGDLAISVLKYKPRLGVSVIQANIAGISPIDIDGKYLGIIAALCGIPRTELGPMDSEDFRAASDVAAFFST